jgi:hypothetical protein
MVCAAYGITIPIRILILIRTFVIRVILGKPIGLHSSRGVSVFFEDEFCKIETIVFYIKSYRLNQAHTHTSSSGFAQKSSMVQYLKT